MLGQEWDARRDSSWAPRCVDRTAPPARPPDLRRCCRAGRTSQWVSRLCTSSTRPAIARSVTSELPSRTGSSVLAAVVEPSSKGTGLYWQSSLRGARASAKVRPSGAHRRSRHAGTFPDLVWAADGRRKPICTRARHTSRRRPGPRCPRGWRRAAQTATGADPASSQPRYVRLVTALACRAGRLDPPTVRQRACQAGNAPTISSSSYARDR